MPRVQNVCRMFSCTWHILIVSNVPRSVETASEREDRLRKRREHDRHRRERETNEERQIAKFVSAWQDVGKTTELDVMV